jgi:hypothetical protein
MTLTAWDLIGFDGTSRTLPENTTRDPYAEDAARYGGPLDEPVAVRVVGGRALYESVGNDGGRLVRLARLDTTDGLHPVVRYVDPDTTMEVVK